MELTKQYCPNTKCCVLSAEAAGHPWPAPQLEERPEPKDTEDSRDLEPGHRQPSAAGELVPFPAFAVLSWPLGESEPGPVIRK